jgi:hypothetical protein
MTFTDEVYEYMDIDFSNSTELVFEKCRSIGARVGMEIKSISREVVLKDIVLRRCKSEGIAFIGPVTMENIVIEDLKIKGSLDFRGTLFKECVFRGRLQNMMYSPLAQKLDPSSRLNIEVMKRNDKSYTATSWALDICEAELIDFCFPGVPAENIVINGETQVAVNHKALKSQNISDPKYAAYVEVLLQIHRVSEANFILATNQKDRSYSLVMDLIRYLREEGCLLPARTER